MQLKKIPTQKFFCKILEILTEKLATFLFQLNVVFEFSYSSSLLLTHPYLQPCWAKSELISLFVKSQTVSRVCSFIKTDIYIYENKALFR